MDAMSLPIVVSIVKSLRRFYNNGGTSMASSGMLCL